MTQIVALFLRSRFLQPRHQQRLEMTQQEFMLQGLGTDFIDAEGDTLLAHLWTSLLLGDYIAYYLAMLMGLILRRSMYWKTSKPNWGNDRSCCLRQISLGKLSQHKPLRLPQPERPTNSEVLNLLEKD